MTTLLTLAHRHNHTALLCDKVLSHDPSALSYIVYFDDGRVLSPIPVHSHAPLRTVITTLHSCATKCSPMIQVHCHTSCTSMMEVYSHPSQCTSMIQVKGGGVKLTR